MSVPAEYAGQLAAAGRERARHLELAAPHLEGAERALELGVELVANARAAGVRLPLAEVARLLGVSRQTLHTRLNSEPPFQRVTTEPPTRLGQ